MKRTRSPRPSPRLLWVTDPWDTLDHPSDTTLRLIQESLRLKIPSYWCDVRSVRWDGAQVVVDAARVRKVRDPRGPADIQLDPPRPESPARFRRILYRTDPPVDLTYLQPLQLLAMAVRGSRDAEIVNPAQALFELNEKLEPALLGKLMPKSVVAAQREPLVAFGKAEGKTVLKPLHQAQGKGVELLDWGTPVGVSAAIDRLRAATEEFTLPVILQRYFPEIIGKGETRLWYLNGKLLAAARKIPREGTFKVNMDEGGRLAPATLSARNARAAREIGAHLRKHRIRLAAIDLIEGYVTDFNVTSPGLLVQFEKLLERNLAEPVLRSLVAPWK